MFMLGLRVPTGYSRRIWPLMFDPLPLVYFHTEVPQMGKCESQDTVGGLDIDRRS